VHSAIDVVEISENALANGLVIDGTAERITPEVDYKFGCPDVAEPVKPLFHRFHTGSSTVVKNTASCAM
jgi:hypothetical protein